MPQSQPFLRPAISLIAAVLLAQAAAFPVTDLVLTLHPAQAGAVFEGIGAVRAGASSRLVIDDPRGLVGSVHRFHPARFDALAVEVPRVD